MPHFLKSQAARSWRTALLLLLAVAVLVPPVPAATPVTVTIMTRNLYFGADLDPIIGATTPEAFAKAAAGLMVQLKNTDFQGRAENVADEVAANNPDVIALQEVSVWRTGPVMAPPATEVMFDQLDLLLSAMAKRKLHYSVVAIQNHLDAEAPAPAAGMDVRLTDRDVILARADWPESVFDITNAQTRRYTAAWKAGSPLLGQFAIPRGWLAADMTMQGVKFRFVTSHLESTCGCGSEAEQVQVSQAQELVASLDGVDVPVILAGDFNSNAEPGPEQTASVRTFLDAGFADTWRTAHPGDAGYTWPLFMGDPTTGPALPNERIDLVLTRSQTSYFFHHGLRVLSAERTGMAQKGWGSDHAGVVVKLQLQ